MYPLTDVTTDSPNSLLHTIMHRVHRIQCMCDTIYDRVGRSFTVLDQICSDFVVTAMRFFGGYVHIIFT